MAIPDRTGCCAEWTKPCSYHEGWIDGVGMVGVVLAEVQQHLTGIVDQPSEDTGEELGYLDPMDSDDDGDPAEHPVLSIDKWPTNGHLIADMARLGYINGTVLDPTYGKGRFWSEHRPDHLIASDLVADRSPIGHGVDFTKLPYPEGTFDTVVFDPPYKLNGTPDLAMDEAYGTDVPTRWQDRMTLIADGLTECARVLRFGGHLLVKCQDQVCSGHIRWQTDMVTDHLAERECFKIDRFDILSYRPQPPGRKQVHGRRNSSTLLVFVKS
jgi:hypothetical protein